MTYFIILKINKLMLNDTNSFAWDHCSLVPPKGLNTHLICSEVFLQQKTSGHMGCLWHILQVDLHKKNMKPRETGSLAQGHLGSLGH